MTDQCPINGERLAADFVRLCETDSPSRQEGKVAALLRDIFAELGAAEIIDDGSAAVTGSDTGNLIIRFPGDPSRDPLFFNCHMDTVEPARGVKVRREGDLFFSSGDTVLGSDDKSGIAAIIEAIRCLRENRSAHRPLEIVLTTCEEIGLLGAKSLDPALLRSRMGYALDSTGFGTVITGAPAANRLNITVRGVAAHAGLHPEWGISAITLAAQAVSSSPHGRVDDLSTINFGTIQGGKATNIVADQVVIRGEIRSHATGRLESLTGQVRDIFARTVSDWRDPRGEARGRPDLTFTVEPDFPVMKLSADDPVLRHVDRAARSIGLKLQYAIAGGGSDANIFNGHGLQTAIIATGMTNVHSTDEQVNLADMVGLTRLLIALATL
ncbi:MAG: M20/M25/M40 family metallo-hydrolase [Desulfobulbaceae bacterium]|jgi:tripeptide aminopeptidase|nr:M20/M25/M40 family metallo-hydrolase [Desulfobulbaceae bacterium]